MKTKLSDSGVKAVKEASEGCYCITDARKSSTKELRDLTGLKKEELAQLIWSEAQNRMAAHRKEVERLQIAAEMKKLGIRTKKEYASIMQEQADAGVYLKKNFPYREAEGRWCEPDNSVSVTITKDEISATGRSQKSYSNNGKWGGVESHYRFQFSKSSKMIVIGGLVTVFAKKDENKPVKRCTWWEQGKGFSLVEKNGWLVGGYHSEAATKEAAVRGAQASRRYYLKKDSQVLTVDLVHKKFGFCYPGIRNFQAQNGIDTDAMTLKDLRDIVVKNRDLNCRHYRSHLAKMGITLNCK